MNEDIYLTISAIATAKYVQQKSIFYAFAIPVDTEEMAENELKRLRKEYYDARHVCYAFQLNADKSVQKSSDNGEPSGTAGRPILGVIQAQGLTNVLIVVVRYFGGIKLGTPGLIAAYRTSAEEALQNAEVIEKTEDVSCQILYAYPQMNDVMTAVKALNVKVIESVFDMDCKLVVRGPKTIIAQLITKVADYAKTEIL